jgi:acetate kinase
MKILTINAGSSSLKYNLYETEGEKLLAGGLIDRIKTDEASLTYKNHDGQSIKQQIAAESYEAAVSALCETLTDPEKGVIKSLKEINGIGHRVVHGASEITGAVKITDSIKKTIKDNFFLAPLHNPPNYEVIEVCEKLFPNPDMVAVFDTAFHQTMPPAAYTYAIDYNLAAKNKIRRYGFHGTSHHYVAHTAARKLGKSFDAIKQITVHLGNGCSVAAVNCGKVQDTSMGLTPLEGLVMGTRCGDIDPAIVLFLLNIGYSKEQIDKMLNKQSGLLGLAGIGSNDMRDILQAMKSGNQQAKLAFEVFIHRLVKYIGAYIAVLNGLDILVFTAGIGENVPLIRTETCKHLQFLGIQIDENKNRDNEEIISKTNTFPAVMVIPTNEELMIARETNRILTQT